MLHDPGSERNQIAYSTVKLNVHDRDVLRSLAERLAAYAQLLAGD